MRNSQRILAVINERALYNKVEDLLDRSSFEVNRVPSGAGALILVGNLRYDLLLVESPLPDLDLQDFVGAVRTLDSPCVGSSILILAQNEQAANLGEALIGDEIQVLACDAEPEEIQKAISDALGVAVRTSTRILVQVEARLEEGSFQRVGQTANISESGMLISGSHAIPLGSSVDLAFELPGDPRVLEIKAEVVRHASPEVESLTGIGVRFTEIDAETAVRLQEFLQARAASLQSLDSDDEPLDLEAAR